MGEKPAPDSLERAIIGALRATIRDHGPITADKIGSAAKRILGQIPNARADGLAAALARRRWDGVSAEERAKDAAARGRSSWAGMSKAEKSEIMRARAATRKRNAKAKE